MSRVWTDAEIIQLADGFEQGTLPSDEWTHHAHIIVSAYHLIHLPYYEAVLHMKLAIPRYNVRSGGSNTIEGGYHETLTLFWMWAIQSYLERHKTDRLAECINALLTSPYAQKYLPFYFYSEDLLFSPKARVQWVDPDIQALDAALISTEYPQSIWYGADY